MSAQPTPLGPAVCVSVLTSAAATDMVYDMRTISLAVSESEYDAFRRAAAEGGRPIAQMIREAMAEYRATRFPDRTRLRSLVVLPGHRPVSPLPTRFEIYDDIFSTRTDGLSPDAELEDDAS